MSLTWESKQGTNFVCLTKDTITNLNCVTQFTVERRVITAYLTNGYNASFKYKTEEEALEVFEALKKALGTVIFFHNDEEEDEK